MHEHDLDLIAALADGSLSDETEARALVESCEVCRDEYRAQTQLIAWLAAAPTPAMTQLDKASLHRELWARLQQEPARRSRTPWWQPLSYVAAGILVVVGLVGVLNNDAMTGGGDAAATTTAAESAAVEDSPGEVPFLAGQDEGEEELAPQAESTTTAAAESIPPPFGEMADEIRAAGEERVQTQSLDQDVDECLEEVGLDQHFVADEIELDQTYLAVMAEDPEAEPIVTFVAYPICEIVYVG